MYDSKEIKTSDKLALDRTVLANERTFLAYVRTFASLLGGGIGLLTVFEIQIIHVGGIVAIIFAVLFLIFGIRRYVLVHNNINKVFNTDEEVFVSLSSDIDEEE